jgi:hypothetical protein
MQSVFEENQSVGHQSHFLDNLLMRYQIVDPAHQANVRLGIGAGCVATVICLNTLLSFI